MNDRSTSPDGDTEGDGLFGQLTVSGHGPVVQEQRENDVVIAKRVQAQVERNVRDEDDLQAVLGGRNPDHDEAVVDALLGDAESLRLPKNQGDAWDMAGSWNVSIDAPIATWLEFAFDQGKPNPDAIDGKKALDFLDNVSRPDRNAGPNALLAAISLAKSNGEPTRQGRLLDRYRERFDPTADDGDSEE